MADDNLKKSMKRKYHIYYLILLSTFIHAVVLAVLPGPRFSGTFPSDYYQIVSVVPFDSTAVSIFREEEFESHVDWLDALKRIDDFDETIDDSLDSNSDQLILPQRHFDEIDKTYEDKIINPVLQDSLAISLDTFNLLPSAMAELPIDVDWKPDQNITNYSVPVDKADRKINTTLGDEQTEPTIENEDQIEGPVASRTVIFKPSLPAVNIETSTVITLKFWVFPDGTVGKIIPLKKADASLEQVAINYLKQWRFTPLPEENSQEDQWGIIPIKFQIY